MYLERVSENLIITDLNETLKTVESYKKTEIYESWKKWRPSQISHHGEICCEIAREWINDTDFSALNGDGVLTGPRWLREKFRWGASGYPLFWCEVARKKTLDCGALAALAYEVFRARGIKTSRVQLVQKFSDVATRQWTNSWSETGASLAWIKGDLIYHEACAIETGERKIKVWDASAGWWIDAKSAEGYGAVLAIRLSGFNLSDDKTFTWGKHKLEAGEWKEII